MKTRANQIVLCVVIVFISFLKYNSVFGQPGKQELPEAGEQVTSEDMSTLTALKGILQTVEEIEAQIRNEKDRFKDAKTHEERLEINKKIDILKKRAESLNENFEAIVTGLDQETFTAKPQKSFDWKEEIQVLIGPIINEMKTITARPRLIENLRTQVRYYEKQISVIKDSLDNIHGLITQARDESLKNRLSSLEEDWYNKGKQVSSQLTVAQYQLADKLREKRSLLESGHNIVRIFFKSRGRNFVLSVLAFLAVFFLLRYIHRHIYKGSLIHKTITNSFYVRLVDVIYHIFTFVGATGILLFVLYICGDWVLLGLAFVIIFGLIWTAKQTLPRFYEQCTLLLNLGTVKENERVIYNGLPWRVDSLHLYTLLVNPELKGGMLRLPLRELKDIKSRPYHPDEPWFPCKENDWVILSDGTMGRVSIQTPEVVQLVIGGGSCKTYPTSEFLGQNPVNISRSFIIKVVFGIDYQHQAICTTEVPDKLKNEINAGLVNEGYGKDIINLNVEFKEAGDSSLDYEIAASFSGQAAQDYYRLSRIIQKIALDTCNKHGWVIPYTTFTIHTAQPQA